MAPGDKDETINKHISGNKSKPGPMPQETSPPRNRNPSPSARSTQFLIWMKETNIQSFLGPIHYGVEEAESASSQ